MSCPGPLENGNFCGATPSNDKEKYCQHHLYLKYYTETMMKTLKPCLECQMMSHLLNGVSCSSCLIQECPTCARPSKLNGYCGKHPIDFYVEMTRKEGYNICTNYTRSCRAQLPKDYDKIKCKDCLDIDRQRDRARRHRARDRNADTILMPSVDGELSPKSSQDQEFFMNGEQCGKYCTSCNKFYPKVDFIGKTKSTTLQCKTCRDANHEMDIKRRGRERNKPKISHDHDTVVSQSKSVETKHTNVTNDLSLQQSIDMFSLDHRRAVDKHKESENDEKLTPVLSVVPDTRDSKFSTDPLETQQKIKKRFLDIRPRNAQLSDHFTQPIASTTVNTSTACLDDDKITRQKKLNAERMKRYRHNKGITLSTRVKLSEDEIREKARLRQEKHRAEMKSKK